MTTERTLYCQNCDWCGPESATEERDLQALERMVGYMSIGDAFSDRECPECGALCFPDPWLSVKETLPVLPCQVLVFVRDFGIGVDQYDAETKQWANFGDTVTHWQPVPNDPKGE
jgi:hypothetical protein